MSIQYAGGTIVNSTFTQTAGTRREIVDELVTRLVAAGWTIVSGGGTGDVLLASATTPQGLKIRCRVWDPGSGNCAGVSMKDTSGLLTSNQYFLWPSAAKTWRVIANRYQWFCFVPGDSQKGEFVCMGTPWIPSFIVPTYPDRGFINGNTNNDSRSQLMASFRLYLASTDNPMFSGLCNNNLINQNAIGYRLSCHLRFVLPYGAIVNSGDAIMWEDNSQYLSEPLLAWGLVNPADWAKVRGQLWDAVIVSGDYAADSIFTFDGHDWMAISNNNVGSTTLAKGTLLVAVN